MGPKEEQQRGRTREKDERRISRAAFYGDPNIGLFGFATDRYVVVPDDSIGTGPLRVLQIFSKVARTNLNGIFLAGNSRGIVAPWIISQAEWKALETGTSKSDIALAKIDAKQTALGNLILCNDSGALVSPLLRDYFAEIKKALGVRVMEGRLMDLDVVGSLALATNKGFLLNMHASQADLKLIKKALKVDGDIGTVNFGSGFVKSGLIANSNGVLIGQECSGPEIARITEALKFL